MNFKIRTYGDSCLRKKSEPIEEIGIAERMLIQNMIETMHENEGIGLAAPQVGINKQLFVMDIGERVFVISNPKILKEIGSGYFEEGCLSVPGVRINIKRPQKIIVKYMNEESKIVEREFSDLLARVFLHETDHLNGKMIVDRAGWREKIKYRKQLKDLQDDNSSKG